MILHEDTQDTESQDVIDNSDNGECISACFLGNFGDILFPFHARHENRTSNPGVSDEHHFG